MIRRAKKAAAVDSQSDSLSSADGGIQVSAKSFPSAPSRRSDLKRKAEDDTVDLEDTIKRFRITYTPGEIRLGKDLKELKNFPGVQFELTDNPSSVIVNYLECNFQCDVHEMRLPSSFLITVPRYYPHANPEVTCMEDGFRSDCIDINGKVTHLQLQNEWSAIGTLATVLQVLECVRNTYRTSLGRGGVSGAEPSANRSGSSSSSDGVGYPGEAVMTSSPEESLMISDSAHSSHQVCGHNSNGGQHSCNGRGGIDIQSPIGYQYENGNYDDETANNTTTNSISPTSDFLDTSGMSTSYYIAMEDG
mmetsp:Transcript_3255/g.5476  ORF Transcript_3255/g.5476 Transcript_3255/m.5476 type:complete len:305 (+) Transcript_3255:114-1028(+)